MRAILGLLMVQCTISAAVADGAALAAAPAAPLAAALAAALSAVAFAWCQLVDSSTLIPVIDPAVGLVYLSVPGRDQ